MASRPAFTTIIALVALSLVVPASAQAQADKDCSDFANQAQAQEYLLPGDPHRLDADDDGKACDALPCPCAASGAPVTAPPPAPVGQPSPVRGRVAAGKRYPSARVLRVIDGDTLKVRLRSGSRRTVRLVGLDAPETKAPGARVECGGRAASAYMRKLALKKGKGRVVTLITDPTQGATDRFGRMLAYVEGEKGDVGKRMIAAGWSPAYVYGKPFQRLSAFEGAERAARSAGLGAWAACRGTFPSQQAPSRTQVSS
jgi:endonuclease YncB( thermonuclease family)